jgi:hypothetical protein
MVYSVSNRRFGVLVGYQLTSLQGVSVGIILITGAVITAFGKKNLR